MAKNSKRPTWAELFEPERIFIGHWRELIGRFGTQVQAAERLHWSKSTVSRDCTGESFPTDKRRQVVYSELGLSLEEVSETEELLARAVEAQSARVNGNSLSGFGGGSTVEGNGDPPQPPLAAGATASLGRRSWNGAAVRNALMRFIACRSRQFIWGAATSCVVILALLSAVLCGSLRDAAARVSCPSSPAATLAQKPPASSPVAHTAVTSGLSVKTVLIRVTSLSPILAANGGWNQAPTCATIVGFVFTNGAADLCLSANDTGLMAGRNGDAVRLAPCELAKNQIWVPVQWETSGSNSTWLANDEYQSKCLNADQTGGLRKGHRAQLWDCYHSSTGNESWDFGDWYAYATAGSGLYPLYLGSHEFCLDADKSDLGIGDEVLIWTEYGASNQLWS